MNASSFIDELLAEQQQLTAVERFAQRHSGLRGAGPQVYRQLIPLERPRPGEQYAFQVDLDLCTGCKACVSACHSLNGLDEDETWRAVDLLHGGSPEHPYQQTVTSACHHCVDPACLNGCPVLAYEKDATTGIVRHLDDQCIGCQYCVLKCPYDVPKYSAKRGIVRKCDMCHSRLAVGEAPACAQACPSSAISIQIVSKETISGTTSSPHTRLLPGSFPSAYTKPATQYVSRKPFPDHCEQANAAHSRLEPAHWPLVWMLVLTQMAAGLFLTGFIGLLFGKSSFAMVSLPLSAFGLASLLTGLTASIFHLGRPLGAWRALLGLRRSWMSREILAFLVFAAAATATVSASWAASRSTSSWMHVTSALGLLSVFCSGMIYVDTRRPAWIATKTFTGFFGTTVVLGGSAATAVLGWLGATESSSAPGRAFVLASFATILSRIPLFVWDLRASHFPRFTIGTFLLATISGLMALSSYGFLAASLACLSFLATFSARIIERYEFFVNAESRKTTGRGSS